MSTPTTLSPRTFVFVGYDKYDANLSPAAVPKNGRHIVLIDSFTVRALSPGDDPSNPSAGTSYSCYEVRQGYTSGGVAASAVRNLGTLFQGQSNPLPPSRDCLIPGSPAYVAIDGGGGVAHLAGGTRRLFPLPASAHDSYRIYPPSWDVGATVSSSCCYPEDVNPFVGWTDYKVAAGIGVRPRLRFDLWPGYYFVNPSGAIPPTLSYSLVVEAQESVTVPAGTFTAYRASVSSQCVWWNWYAADYSASFPPPEVGYAPVPSRDEWVIWFVPSLGYWVKARHRFVYSTVAFGSSGGATAWQGYELESYL